MVAPLRTDGLPLPIVDPMKTKPPGSRPTRRTWIPCGLALLAAACAVLDARPAPAATEDYEADGVHVRHARLRVAPAHTKDFEALMARCVEAAKAVALEDDWLCYRESPGRYWLLLFGSERGGFMVPPSADPLRAFAEHVAELESGAARDEIVGRLAALEYHVEWTMLMRQRTEWSTVEDMSTSTHPKARMIVRSVRPGRERAFAEALDARTAFLRENAYPLPVEGFVTLAGAPGTATQVVFPTDWPTFHASDSFGAFARGLSDEPRADYARRKAALMETMLSAEYYDGDFLPEQSYSPE